MKNKMEYFDLLYDQNDDPWDYENRWYEERKRSICLAVLLKPIYQNVLEIGCSNGVFSRYLALRSKQLTCLDGNEKACDLAKIKLGEFSHVQVLQRIIPEQFPKDKYDLIVIGEVLYYLNYDELLQLLAKIHQSLTKDGMVLSCHWRHPVDEFVLNGDQVHQVLLENLKLNHYLSLNDPDFLIDLWTTDTLTLADQEGLI